MTELGEMKPPRSDLVGRGDRARRDEVPSRLLSLVVCWSSMRGSLPLLIYLGGTELYGRSPNRLQLKVRVEVTECLAVFETEKTGLANRENRPANRWCYSTRCGFIQKPTGSSNRAAPVRSVFSKIDRLAVVFVTLLKVRVGFYL